jgi:hypothetical protein
MCLRRVMYNAFSIAVRVQYVEDGIVRDILQIAVVLDSNLRVSYNPDRERK